MNLEKAKDAYVKASDKPLVFLNHNECLKELFQE